MTSSLLPFQFEWQRELGASFADLKENGPNKIPLKRIDRQQTAKHGKHVAWLAYRGERKRSASEVHTESPFPHGLPLFSSACLDCFQLALREERRFERKCKSFIFFFHSPTLL